MTMALAEKGGADVAGFEGSADIQPTMIPVSELRANEYNPNEMTEDEFAEFVAEVRHLGRLPKPVVVRTVEDGYVIVDGEHAWRAAEEVGLEEVPCEIIEVDDFEARRQTYKRNQHGTHDRVRLGQMFRQMKELRGLSNRALAEDIDVSEGTIRNVLLYAEAAEVRKGYAFQDRTLEDVRFYIQTLPGSLRDAWLDSGATHEDVTKALGDQEDWFDYDEKVGEYIHSYTSFDRWAEKGIRVAPECCYSPKLFIRECHRISQLGFWLDRREGRIENLIEYVRPIAEAGDFHGIKYLKPLPFSEASEDGKQSVLITPDEWWDVYKRAQKHNDVVYKIMGAIGKGVKALLIKKGLPTEDMTKPENDLKWQELIQSAPSYIYQTPLPLDDKCELFKLAAECLSDDELGQAKKLTIAAIIEDGTRDITETFWAAVTQVQMGRSTVKVDGLKQDAEALDKWFARCPVRLKDDQVSLLVDYVGAARAANDQRLKELAAEIRAMSPFVVD